MELFDLAVERVKALFRADHPLCVAWSSGKDSSCILAITLEAALQAKEEGHAPYVVITHADNREIARYDNRSEGFNALMGA